MNSIIINSEYIPQIYQYSMELLYNLNIKKIIKSNIDYYTLDEINNSIEIFIPFNKLQIRRGINNIFPKYQIIYQNDIETVKLNISASNVDFFTSKYRIGFISNLEDRKSKIVHYIEQIGLKYVTNSYFHKKEGFVFSYFLKDISSLVYNKKKVKLSDLSSNIYTDLSNYSKKFLCFLLYITVFFNYYSLIEYRESKYKINREYLVGKQNEIKVQKDKTDIVLDFRKILYLNDNNDGQQNLDKSLGRSSCEYQFEVRGHYRRNKNGTYSWVRAYTKNREKEIKDKNYRLKL